MEERLSAFSIDSTGNDPHLLHLRPSPANYEPVFQPRPFPSRKASVQDRSRSTASIESETYVIQIPKEQIFNVPPPENAIIAERYRKPETKKSPRRKRLLFAVVTLVMFAAIAGLTIGALRIVFNPEPPSFSIVHVYVKNYTHGNSSHHNRKNTHSLYEITLKVKNKNKLMENYYGRNGHWTLLYNGHKIGTGKLPEFDQDANSLKNIQWGLTGSNGELPHEIERSIGDKMGKRHATLSLKMNVPVKVIVWNKVIYVVCNFKVRSLGYAGKKNNVLSQHCQTNFK